MDDPEKHFIFGLHTPTHTHTDSHRDTVRTYTVDDVTIGKVPRTTVHALVTLIHRHTLKHTPTHPHTPHVAGG